MAKNKTKSTVRSMDIRPRRVEKLDTTASGDGTNSASSLINSPAAAKYDNHTISKPKQRWSKKTKLIVFGLSGVIALVLLATLAYATTRPKPIATRTQTDIKTAQSTPKPATVASPLTGVEVSPEAAKKPVVAVVIENLYPNARPQSGLSSAGVVYEALAEGGITRYLAIFQDQLAPDIGPVRSLRTYFIDWGLEYDAPVAHVGGNIDALNLIKPLGMKNLDQFYNSAYFRRITSRSAPHNVYISDSQMNKLLSDRGYNGEPTFKPWLRKDDNKSTNLTASVITVNFSSADYQAKFDYDPNSNSYTRSIRNTADIDANGKVAIKPKNVIVMQIPTQFGASASGQSTAVMQTVGSGKATIFMDGVAIEATWKKDDHKARTQFFDANGKEIALNRGQTWVAVLPTDRSFSYQ